MRTHERIFVATAIVLGGCSAIIGVKDLSYDDSADPSKDGGGSSSSSSTSSSSSSGGEGGADAMTNPCNADLQKDVLNCGRCGRDCVGGKCTAGQCEAVELAPAQGGPNSLVLDATAVYFANLGDGNIVKVPKSGGAVTKVIDQRAASGIALDGTTLYFGGYTSIGNGGGLFRCELADCETTKQSLSTTGYVLNIVVDKGVVYWTGNNSDVRRVNTDGQDERVLRDTVNPYGLAVDDQHVYYTSLAINLARVPLDGGAPEIAGPKGSKYNDTYVFLDKDRFYWAFYDAAEVGFVYAADKANTATRTTFTSTGKGSVAVVADATYVYWLDAGSYTTKNEGKVYACKKTGCVGPPIELARDLQLGGQLVQDEKALYWVEHPSDVSGRVRKVAKP